MPLCQMCEAIPRDLFEKAEKDHFRNLVHHRSLKSLELSAKEGCNVCTLLHNTILQSRNKNAYPCGTAGPGFLEGLKSQYTHSGLPENVASKEGHRTYIWATKWKSSPSGRWIYTLKYQVGRGGFVHVFDTEFSDDPNSTNLHPLSNITFSLAQSWIDQCVEDHAACNIRYDTRFKPTRLIDVGQRGTSPRLIETTSADLKDSRYLALSHRWGSSMPEYAMTKVGTLPRRLSKIPINRLPSTFRDAVIATRRLGLQYLWIDSLCILQDSPEDWQKESALMGKVYSHSFCMIAAAAADDCFGGLFPSFDELPIIAASTEDPDSHRLRSALIKQRFEGWDGLLNTSKLNQRGWTLQERELSPRILYFTKHTLLFECRIALSFNCLEPKVQELDPDPRISLAPKEFLGKYRKARRCLDQSFPRATESRQFEVALENRYLNWMNTIENYSERTLSMPSDKFPGLSGLASEYAYILDDQYVAGLWRRDLCRGLCWRWKPNDIAHRPSQRTRKRQMMNYGPSWSWAKMIVPISYDLVSRLPATGLSLETETDLESLDQVDPLFLDVTTIPEGKDPNGTLISGTIHLEGRVVRVSRSKTGNFKILGESVEVTWDFLPQTVSVYDILSLGRTGVGLVLTPTDLNSQEYLCVGILPRVKAQWFENSDRQKLTLV